MRLDMNYPLDYWSKVQSFVGAEDTVTKFVFTNPDSVVEAVLYKYPDYQTRTVICCSTMSGCPIGE